MINHIAFAQLGKANHGWLRANHHFSFAHYYNPQRMGFGTLRVINDDWVQAGAGFPSHPHQNMEIISFVRSGAITHQDSMGNTGITPAGEVQVMSAGTGIMHSEYNRSTQPLTLYQIWIEPKQQGVAPRWDSKKFATTSSKDSLPLLVSGYKQDAEQALFIHQDARIYGGKVTAGSKITLPIIHQAYVLASSGSFTIFDEQGQAINLHQGDGAEVTAQSTLKIEATAEAEIIVIDAP
ncbi:pirin family protein [Shewanella waksmanii]|uniref:pirin family protein n=1 Tax=Shewanella waksmanii TaxID=213783 RepID=UPI00048BC6AE|nr:pirin-like bicupin family protein [Shewanella waksmanii]